MEMDDLSCLGQDKKLFDRMAGVEDKEKVRLREIIGEV